MRAVLLALAASERASFGTTLGTHAHKHEAAPVGAADHAAGLGVAGSDHFGTDFKRTFTKYDALPQSADALGAAGWKTGGQCDALLGVAWNVGGTAPTKKQPLTIYTTSNGAVSGIGVRVFGAVKPKLTTLGFFDSRQQLDVAFRADPCADSSATPGEGGLGDRVVVAPHGAKHEFPLTTPGNMHQGSCFDSMGTHYFADVTTDSGLSFRAENLVPVVPMYHDGKINAIFFASATMQQSIFPPSSNTWEPVYLINPLMCQNFCDAGCTFHDTHGFSTSHIYFNDPSTVKCDPGLKCSLPHMGCCPAADLFV